MDVGSNTDPTDDELLLIAIRLEATRFHAISTANNPFWIGLLLSLVFWVAMGLTWWEALLVGGLAAFVCSYSVMRAVRYTVMTRAIDHVREFRKMASAMEAVPAGEDHRPLKPQVSTSTRKG